MAKGGDGYDGDQGQAKDNKERSKKERYSNVEDHHNKYAYVCIIRERCQQARPLPKWNSTLIKFILSNRFYQN